MSKIGIIIITLGDTTPESYGQPPNKHSASYTPFLEQLIEEKFESKKSLEALYCPSIIPKYDGLTIPKKNSKFKNHTPFFMSQHNKKKNN